MNHEILMRRLPVWSGQRQHKISLMRWCVITRGTWFLYSRKERLLCASGSLRLKGTLIVLLQDEKASW